HGVSLAPIGSVAEHANARPLGAAPLGQAQRRPVCAAIADEEDFPVFRGAGQEVNDLAPRPVQRWTGIVGGKNQAKRPCLASPCRDALLHASTPPSSAACRVPLDQSSYTKRAQCCVYPIRLRAVKTHRKWRRRDVIRRGKVDKLAKGICLIRIVCS